MAHIIRQCTVARNRLHNAFTDLQYWQGCYWVSYRRGAAHVSMDGEAVVAVSADRERFHEASRLKLPGDNRDPKLVPMTDGRLALIFPTWLGGHSKRELQQYVAFSEDGFNWTTPQSIFKPRWWLWRVIEHQGRYYGAAYSHRDPQTGQDRVYNTDLVISDNMIDWEVVSRVGTTAMGLGEAGLIFRPDGELWIVSRSATPLGYSYFCAAKPPYMEWECVSLQTLIHAPVILEHQGELYVAGRRSSKLEGDTTYPFMTEHSLGVWKLTRGAVEPVLRIPATGDCSYPGLIADPEGRVCLSYYSQHAYTMGILPQRHIQIDQVPHNTGQVLPQSDVYFAELSLP
jgi:hypothetical protein